MEIENKLAKILSEKLNIKIDIVIKVIEVIDNGSTIPFIARYRKELTGGLTDEELRNFDSLLKQTRNLLKRKEEVINILEELGVITDKIKEDIEKANTLIQVEDIYRPYKAKKKTKASVAKELGLENLAKYIFSGKYTEKEIIKEAEKYMTDKVLNVNEAINYAKDIIAENISDMPEIRTKLKDEFLNFGMFISKKNEKIEDEKEIYKMYYDFTQKIKDIPSHRILACNRGEKEKILKIKLEIDKDAEEIIYKYLKIDNFKEKEILKSVIKDSYTRLIFPSIEREIRNILTEKADEEAINIFGKNLKQLLLTPAFPNINILGYDPGFRTGSKLAAIDGSGKLLETNVIYPVDPKNEIEKSTKILKDIIIRNNIKIISLGNGTASRESEKFICSVIKDMPDVKYIITSEAGASVYSASKLGTEEFPDLDVSYRGAVSIARRVNDPMAEYVKIEPKALGIGQYQHDVNQKMLEEKLSGITMDTVNYVGVDLNTATFSLLSYVSGISKNVAKNIVQFREKNGKFNERIELKKVSGIGEKSFEESAGFLRIYGGKNAFEVTGIHPETYNEAEYILKYIGYNKEDILNEKILPEISNKLGKINTSEISNKLKIGIPTVTDIINEIRKTGRDIREEAPKPILKSDVLTYEDVKIGEILKGTVRNITAFGVFVDIGIKNDGLLHISEISNKYIKDISNILSVGDIVNVKIIEKNDNTKQVKLSMKELNNI